MCHHPLDISGHHLLNIQNENGPLNDNGIAVITRAYYIQGHFITML